MMLERKQARFEALSRAAEKPVYVGSGYGQIFEATLELIGDGSLRYMKVDGVTHAEMTEKGRAEFALGRPPRNYCIDCGRVLSEPGGECSKCKKGLQP